MTSPIALSGCFLRRGVPLGTPNACMCFVCVCVCLFVCSSCLQFVLGPGVKCAVARWIDGCSDFKASFSLSFVRLVGACVQHDVVSALSARSNVCGRFRNEHAVVRVDRSCMQRDRRLIVYVLCSDLVGFRRALSPSASAVQGSSRAQCAAGRALFAGSRRTRPSKGGYAANCQLQTEGLQLAVRGIPPLKITIVLFQVVSRKTHPPIFA